jgi:hypothetical protein
VQAKERFDATRREVYYEEGDKVYLKIQNRKPGVSPKLAQSYAGPFVVKRRLAENDYEIEQLDGKKSQVVNVQRLKAYHKELASEEPEVPEKKVTFCPLVEEIEEEESELMPISQEIEEEVAEIDLADSWMQEERKEEAITLPSGMKLRPRTRQRYNY